MFRPPYAVNPIGPFGVDLIAVEFDRYRFQLEGFVEEDRFDQNQTIILLHSVKDGKTLRIKANADTSKYGFEILEWQIDRNFDSDGNTEIVARLKLKDHLTNRIINLRHDERLYEDTMEIAFKDPKTNEIFILRKENTSFNIGDIEFILNEVDYEGLSVSMTKLIPDSEPISEILYIKKQVIGSNIDEIDIKDKLESSSKPNSIEEAFNSFLKKIFTL